MIKMKKFLTFSIFAALGLSVFFSIALAAPLKYQPLEPLDISHGTTGTLGASDYIRIFLSTFMIVIVALAVLKVVLGGIKIMMAGDSASARGDAKEDIMQAVYGLILALLTYTILYKVNPRLIPGSDLFNFNISAPAQK